MISITMQRLQKLPRLLLIIFFVLLIINIFAIFIAYVSDHSSFYGLLDKFYFLLENNIPTYFSSINLLIAAGLIFSIYDGNKKLHVSGNKYWLFLSIIFLCLSADEVASIHELAMRPVQEILSLNSTGPNWLYFPWVIVGIGVVLVLAAFFLKFYLRLPLRYKLLFGISAALLIGGAIGMEVIDGRFYNDDVTTKGGVLYFLLTTLEESMEMLGIILFIKSLIAYMKAYLFKPDVTNSPVLKTVG